MSIYIVRLVRFALSLASDCWTFGRNLLIFVSVSGAAMAVFTAVSALAGWAATSIWPSLLKAGVPVTWLDRTEVGAMVMLFASILGVGVYGLLTFVHYLRAKWAALSSS